MFTYRRRRASELIRQRVSNALKRYCAGNNDGDKLLETAINKLSLSARAYSRVLKVGHTIADLAGTEEIQPRPHRRSDPTSESGSQVLDSLTGRVGGLFFQFQFISLRFDGCEALPKRCGFDCARRNHEAPSS